MSETPGRYTTNNTRQAIEWLLCSLTEEQLVKLAKALLERKREGFGSVEVVYQGGEAKLIRIIKSERV